MSNSISSDYPPLEPSALGEEALRALASAPAKMMAARGAAPIANPVDLLSLLYQLSVLPDASLQPLAQETAAGLPPNVIKAGISSPNIDPRVLDYFISYAQCRSDLFEVAILNSVSADSTITKLAALASESQVELIAENQQRLLRHPSIIAAIYKNGSARMSTVDRIVELAVRQNIEVPELPTWNEISRAMLGLKETQEEELSQEDAAKQDALFQSILPAENDDDNNEEPEEEKEIAIRDMSIPAKLRLAMMGNKFQRAQLVRDPKKLVALAVIKSPTVKENEATAFAGNNSICEDVIAYIGNKKEWTKLYQVKLALVNNPKCPLALAIRFLPHLRARDLTAIARSRSIPSALAAQAKKLSNARTGKR